MITGVRARLAWVGYRLRAFWRLWRAGRASGGSIAPAWPDDEDQGELLAFQVAHGIYRCPVGCTEHTLERALRDDRVPAVLSPGGTLLTCEATVRARHDQFMGATACCPRHGWSSLIGISFDEDGPRDEWGRPTRWTSAVLECGATLEPVDEQG